MHFKTFAKYTLLGIVLLALCSSCSTKKFLGENEFLLKGNSIVLKDAKKIKNKRTLKYELSTLYKQQKNGKFFFIPREWFYFKLQDPNDTTRFDRWKRRYIAEVPAIYDEDLTSQTEQSMLYYLQYQGYFDAQVIAEKDTNEKRKRVKVTYEIRPNQQSLVDTLIFLSKDPNIQKILDEIQPESHLNNGAPIEGTKYELEKKRITTYLRNHGYANFNSNYISLLEADTTSGKANLVTYLEVLPPYNDSLHRKFKVGQITIYPNFNAGENAEIEKDTFINFYHFRMTEPEFKVKPETIANAITFRTGSDYRQVDYDQTYKNLSQLGIYKFVRIKQEPSYSPGILNITIELTPSKKMDLGMDFDINYTNRSASVINNLIGITASPSLRNRNLLKGAELFVTNLSAGVEINPNFTRRSRFFNTVDLGIQMDLYLPRFVDYLGLYKFMNKVPLGKNKKLFGDDRLQKLKEDAVTRFSASYNYLLIIEFYRYNLFNATFGYELRPSSNKRLLIDHVGIDFLQPFTDPPFDTLLSTNPFLERSFGQQLFFSMFFRELDYTVQSKTNRLGESNYLGINFELAGAEIWAGNAIYNAFALKSDTLRIGETDFSQYAKFQADLRYYKQFSPKASLAARVHFGIARPFGFTTDVPYVKQLFAGGPNSIRAWAPRELGPGGYLDTLAHSFENPFRLNAGERFRLYQTGDLLFEFNIEYRFDIFWALKAAIFLDGGNVWTLQRDPSRCGSQFLFRSQSYPECTSQGRVSDPFYKQIALGTGLGIRLDFKYFLLRLDLGVKLRNPVPRMGDSAISIRESAYWNDFSSFQLRDLSFNLGFGYPF